MKTKMNCLISVIALVFLSACFGYQDVPVPTVKNSLGVYLLDYSNNSDPPVATIGDLQIVENSDGFYLEIHADTAEFTTLTVSDITILNSGIAFNIPDQQIIHPDLNTEVNISGTGPKRIKGSQDYDGYIWFQGDNISISFGIEIIYTDTVFSQSNDTGLLTGYKRPN